MPERDRPGLPDLAADLALLRAAAEAGGRVAMEHFGRPLRVWEKGGEQGPVSEADLAVNAVLAERLRGPRPDYGWLSEEDAADPARLAAPRVFVVDPIDGTRAFIDRRPDFAIALAVVEAGRPVAGVVHLPARGETYWASRGGGAWLGERLLAVSRRDRLEGARVLANRSQFRAEHWPGGVPTVDLSFRSALEWRLCLVAAGRFDLALTFRDAWEWDVAAGGLIAAEAGAAVTDGQGAELRFNRPGARLRGVIAAPPGLHAQLLARRAPPRP